MVGPEAIREQLFRRFPLHVHLGLDLERGRDGTLEVILPDRPETTNSLGTQAAASLFAAADAASGVTLVQLLGDELPGIAAVVHSAQLRFERPAHGPVRARGRVDVGADHLLALVATAGRTTVDVLVDVVDEHAARVATATLRWRIRQPRPNSALLWEPSG